MEGAAGLGDFVLVVREQQVVAAAVVWAIVTFAEELESGRLVARTSLWTPSTAGEIPADFNGETVRGIYQFALADGAATLTQEHLNACTFDTKGP
jgi:hypothetical protein